MMSVIRDGPEIPRQEKNVEEQKSCTPVLFHLTSFGKFNGVPDNPTTHLTKSFGDANVHKQEGLRKRYEVRSISELEVSAEVGGKQLLEIHARPCDGGEGSLADDTSVSEVFVHFGVCASSTKFKLERYAYNVAIFRVPDQQGYQPCNIPVDPETPNMSHTLTTDLNVTDVLDSLRTLGWGDRVEDSDDPGRYVCNFLYYKSLLLCHKFESSKHKGVQEGDNGQNQVGPKHHCLFVHIPPFTAISKEEQVRFVSDLLDVVSNSLQSVKASPILLSKTERTDDDVGLDGTSVARRKLMEMGFEEKDVDACLDTTGSSDLNVNLNLLKEVAALPRPFEESGAGAKARRKTDMGRGAWGQAQLIERERIRMESMRKAPPRPVLSVERGLASPHWHTSKDLKMILLVRRDLFMGVGKVAAQCCRATLAVVRRAQSSGHVGTVSAWQATGENTVVLGIDSQQDLEALLDTAQIDGIPAAKVWDDAQKNVHEGTCTVGAIGPAPAHMVDAITGELPTL